MKTLTLRIYLTIVSVLLLFAFGSGWLYQHHIQQEREQMNSAVSERMAALGELIQNSLPGVDAPPADQAEAMLEWSQRLRLPLALDDQRGHRIAASASFVRRSSDNLAKVLPIRLEDGRTLWVIRPGKRRAGLSQARSNSGLFNLQMIFTPATWQGGVGLVILLVLLFVAVAAGAWPAVNRLTRRLQALQEGVEQFGAGKLNHRVDVSGRDEVAMLAISFNLAAERIEALVIAHQSLLANASHELRSPLARMKMAVAMLEEAAPEQRERFRSEINANVAELDALVEEVLLASRLDALKKVDHHDRVDLLAMAAEEGAHVDAVVHGEALSVLGDERLLRRALRNLLENARRYGGHDIEVKVCGEGDQVKVQVCDRGPGVPEAFRLRIFEPFYRLPGHAEQAGGVGLGLSLVKQIAQSHGGSVVCKQREGGGSCFELSLMRAED